MRIVHILPNLKGGGIQNLLLSLAPMQAQYNHEVILITVEKDELDYSLKLKNRIEQKGVTVICLNRIVGNKVSSILALLKCIYVLHKIKADVVNSHSPLIHIYSALGTMLIRSKHILTVHNAPEVWSKTGYFLNSKKPLIFCSKSARELNNYGYINEVATIENGVDRDLVVSPNVSDLREKYNLPANTRIVVGAGSLRPQKNYPFWIELADSCANQDIHFFICGGHYGEGYVDPVIFKGKKNITWLNLRSDIPEILNCADCFLSCSTFEGLPISVLEAYFSGIPCVLSPIPQHINIARNISECYIPKDFSVSAFKSCIMDACSTLKSHKNILKERELFLDVFSIKNTATQYIDFYKKCLK